MPRTARIEQPTGAVHPDLTSPQAGDNGASDEDYIFARGQIRRLEEEAVAFRRKRKQIRSQLSLRGVVLADVDWALEEEKREPGTTAAILRNRMRIAKLFDLDTFAQFDLFDGTKGKGKNRDSAVKTAGRIGYEHGLEGVGPDEQAFPPTTPEGQEYSKQWDVGKANSLERWAKIQEDLKAAETAKEAKKNGTKAEPKPEPAEGDEEKTAPTAH